MDNFYKDDTLIMRILCAVLFLSFTFVYLYFYQADILAVTQHVLSGGTTHYNRTIGSILITIVLWLVQLGVFSCTQLRRRAHALTFVNLAMAFPPINAMLWYCFVDNKTT